MNINEFLDRFESVVSGQSGDAITDLSVISFKVLDENNATYDHWKRFEHIIAVARFAA